MSDEARNWRVDVHHHVVPPEFADDSMPIKPLDAEAQLRSMDSWHIRAAITSLTPRVLLKNLHRLPEVARACNEFQAQRMRDHRGRFGSFALLPLPDVDGALKETSYALDVLRLGAAIFARARRSRAYSLGLRSAVCLRRKIARRSRALGEIRRDRCDSSSGD